MQIRDRYARILRQIERSALVGGPDMLLWRRGVYQAIKDMLHGDEDAGEFFRTTQFEEMARLAGLDPDRVLEIFGDYDIGPGKAAR